MVQISLTLVESVTVGSGGASSIEFTSIPGDATDLLILTSLRVSSLTGYHRIEFNGSTTGLDSRYLEGSGSSVYSSTFGLAYIGQPVWNTQTSNTFANGSIYIPNYAGSTNKSISVDNVSENNATAAYQSLVAGIWANTAAITSIKLYHNGDNYAQYSTASLYKITKA